jgi:hypothetical protein
MITYFFIAPKKREKNVGDGPLLACRCYSSLIFVVYIVLKI